jgi:hypothetical protein
MGQHTSQWRCLLSCTCAVQVCGDSMRVAPLVEEVGSWCVGMGDDLGACKSSNLGAHGRYIAALSTRPRHVHNCDVLHLSWPFGMRRRRGCGCRMTWAHRTCSCPAYGR